tara:strand:- start:15060 stop:15230 length:171 start_codon:yes stop_codon:yes gene_type:complete
MNKDEIDAFVLKRMDKICDKLIKNKDSIDEIGLMLNTVKSEMIKLKAENVKLKMRK